MNSRLCIVSISASLAADPFLALFSASWRELLDAAVLSVSAKPPPPSDGLKKIVYKSWLFFLVAVWRGWLYYVTAGRLRVIGLDRKSLVGMSRVNWNFEATAVKFAERRRWWVYSAVFNEALGFPWIYPLWMRMRRLLLLRRRNFYEKRTPVDLHAGLRCSPQQH